MLGQRLLIRWPIRSRSVWLPRSGGWMETRKDDRGHCSRNSSVMGRLSVIGRPRLQQLSYILPIGESTKCTTLAEDEEEADICVRIRSPSNNSPWSSFFHVFTTQFRYPSCPGYGCIAGTATSIHPSIHRLLIGSIKRLSCCGWAWMWPTLTRAGPRIDQTERVRPSSWLVQVELIGLLESPSTAQQKFA